MLRAQTGMEAWMILCGGENLMDVIEERGTNPRRFAAHAGGSPYNCVRAIARLGAAAGYLGTVSTDSFGVQLLDALQADGVAHLGARSDAPTTLAMVTVTNGQPDYRFYRDGTADRQVGQLALPAGTQALHLGSIALVEGADATVWAELFARAAQAGIVTSLDPNVRALLADAHADEYRLRLATMAAQASIIKLSDEDIGWWFPDLPPAQALDRLADMAPRAVLILTQGPAEVLCRWAGGSFAYRPAPLLTLGDTVGAGDTLMAATLAGLARKGALTRAALETASEALLEQVIADAARAAAITCSRVGCNPPIATEVWGA
jgi:fructokinase